MHSAIALFAPPFLGQYPGHSQRPRLAPDRLDQEEEKGFVSEVVWAQHMALRRRVLDNRMVWAVAGMKVVLDTDHSNRWFEGQRSLLAAQEELKRQGCGCEKVDYLWLWNEAGNP